MKKRVRSGEVPGFLAYRDSEAVGWCAVEPRETYPALARSRILEPIDDAAVWSVTCFFVRKEYRRRGISVSMLRAVAEALRARGVRLLEGYPVEPRNLMADPFVYTGLASAFRRAGFREVARRSPTRPIMRRRLRPTGDAT